MLWNFVKLDKFSEINLAKNRLWDAEVVLKWSIDDYKFAEEILFYHSVAKCELFDEQYE